MGWQRCGGRWWSLRDFRQRNVDLPAFDLNSRKNIEVRTAGIIGLPVLSMFRFTIDYRNGLVKLDYLGK